MGRDPHRPSRHGPKGSRTHPGTQRVVTRLLDAADKVPSFCLEQEPTPGGSSLRGLRAAGPAVREPTSPAPPATAHPTQARAGQSGLTECQALAGKAAPRRPPIPGFHPPPQDWGGKAGPYPAPGAACRVLTWGTTWHALSRGHPLAPSSADPRGRRSTSLGLAALGGAWMLALPTPGPSVPPGAPSPTR